MGGGIKVRAIGGAILGIGLGIVIVFTGFTIAYLITKFINFVESHGEINWWMVLPFIAILMIGVGSVILMCSHG